MKANKRIRDMRRIRQGRRKVALCPTDGMVRRTTTQIHKEAPQVRYAEEGDSQ